MKFKGDPKDFAIFGGFAVLLFFIVALAIENFTALANGGSFAIIPIHAFSDYLTETLVFYFIALVGIMFSVSSYFFEREKGFGLDLKKEDKGYSRWTSLKEMKKVTKRVDHNADKVDAAGAVIINDGKEVWVDDSENHTLIIGTTGSGKTSLEVQPMVKLLAKNGESMIITDPKGEIYKENCLMLKEKGYNIVLINLREPQKGNAWNPLDLPYKLYQSGNSDKAIELLEDLGKNIIYDESNKSGDPFWENTSADFFSGLALSLFEDAKKDEININSIGLMTTVGDDRIGTSNYLKEYFNTKDPASASYVSAASTVNAPNETKGGIISVFKQKIKIFTTRDNLSEMLSYSDFDMRDIGRKKTAVFLVIHDEKKTYHPLATTFLKQCYESLIDVAQEYPNGKLPNRTNFILDEFANMPPIKDITTMVTAARSRNIRLTLIIQNFAQLYQVYGKENGETIRGNCSTLIYLISSELAALEEISKMCGEEKSKEKDKTASTPLVTVSDLQRLKEGEVIILRARMQPFRTKLEAYYKMPWGKKYDLVNYQSREKREYHLFDLKAYVKAKKDAEMAAKIADGRKAMNSMPNTPTPKDNAEMLDVVERLKQEFLKEKEEAKKRQTAVNNSQPVARDFKPIIEEPVITPEIKPVVEEPKPTPTVAPTPIIEPTPLHISEPKVIEEKDDTTEDQFFDDFFNDE